MQVYKTKYFNRWAKKVTLTDKQITQAVYEIEQGLIDAQLGAYLIKKRVSNGNRGKSAGFRTLLAYKEGKRSIFVFGFEKNDRGNIKKQDEEALKSLAKLYMGFTMKELNQALLTGELIEVKDDEQKDT